MTDEKKPEEKLEKPKQSTFAMLIGSLKWLRENLTKNKGMQ